MITIKELVDTYLQAKGLKRLRGAEEDATPILPLIIMDSAFQLYDTYINPIKCKHEMKKLKNDWVDAYNKFNRDYFSCYSEEQTLFIVDMMDTFEDYIKNDLKIAFIQFTSLFKNESLERQKVISACLLSNVLCQSAEIVWERVYNSCDMKTNRYIIACERIMHKWGDIFYGREKPSIDPNKNSDISLAVNVLCKRQMEFLRLYYKEK